MPRTAEPVDVTPGTKTKDFEIKKLQGKDLATPIKYSATWIVPTVDEIVTALSNAETANQVIEELTIARRDSAAAEARAKAILDNEPPEVKIEKGIKLAEKMNPGKDRTFYEKHVKAMLELQ